MTEFKCINTATELPYEWDQVAENYFQKRKFLIHTELHNPCHQRYYIYKKDGKIVAAAVVYTLQLDIFTYLKIKSPFQMNIVGIPCSVSANGIFGDEKAIDSLKEHIYKTEKGLVLILNLSVMPKSNNSASGKTLPTIVFNHSFSNWENYIHSLRSGYRRRINRINTPNASITINQTSCSQFTDEMHRQYLDVFNRSKGKLEKLSRNFFQQLPPEFLLTTCRYGNEMIGWNITLIDGEKHYFFLGGVNYDQNKIHNTYFRLLTQIIKDSFEKKTKMIDFGQTAEIAKTRMGGKVIPLYMEARHSNPIFNFLLKKGAKLLEYKRVIEKTKPIKEGIK